MASKSIGIVLLITLLINSCTLTPATEQESTIIPEVGESVISTMTFSAIPPVHLPEVDEIVFTIPNPEPFSGREGEVRPNWLGWGAETFTVGPNGDFWIDDTAVFPNWLLHYSPRGELLQEISLENLAVYPYDLAVTQDSVWVLDISSQPQKIIQLAMDGTFRSSIDFSKIRTQTGTFIPHGQLYSLSLGEQGELVLQTRDDNYEMIDASGKLTARPLEALEYYNHVYQTGIFSEATNQLPIYVDGAQLDIDPDFFIEMPFLGFHPDGSFALAGSVEDAEHRIDHQVRYYSPTGELLGIARQQPQTFGKDWNHHLAFGPDGAIYQLLSNPDHSVQVLRLGFSEEVSPLPKPTPTPTPLTVFQPSESATTDEEQARNVLLTFFSDLNAQNYSEAATHFGGEKIEYAREMMPGETLGEYWEYICSTVLWCLPVVADITDTEQVSDDEFIFYVVFVNPDGTRFGIGACCGGDPAAFPPVWQFAYPVRKIGGEWKVMRGPVFFP